MCNTFLKRMNFPKLFLCKIYSEQEDDEGEREGGRRDERGVVISPRFAIPETGLPN